MEFKAKTKALLKLIVSAALLWVLYSRVDFSGLRARIASINPWFVALALALMALNTLVSSRKWQLLLAADSITVKLRHLFISHLIGSFFNLFLPSTIGGDAYRIADIGARTDLRVRTAASILVDRITGFLALAIYGLIAALVVRGRIPNWDNGLLILPTVAFLALCAVWFILCRPRFVKRCCNILPIKTRAAVLRIVDPILESVHAYIQHPITCVRVMLMAFLFQLDAIFAVWALATSVGIQIPLSPYFFFVPLVTLMEMIPISIFGIGIRDTAYVWFMKAMASSAPEAAAAAISIIYVAVTVLYVGFGGLLFVIRRKQ